MCSGACVKRGTRGGPFYLLAQPSSLQAPLRYHVPEARRRES
jgi:hypothetical protein